jgi:hypothetical protein
MIPIRMLLIVAASVAAPVTAAVAADPDYALRQSSLGSRIERTVAQSQSIPMNLAYADLSPEQKEIVRNWYEALGPNDEPPFPRAGLNSIFRHVAEVQRAAQTTGTVRMDVEIDAKGVAQSVQVLESPDPQVARAIASVLMQAAYKPGLCAGTPCRMSYPFLITFSLR